MSKKVKMLISAYIIMAIGLVIWTLIDPLKINIMMLIVVAIDLYAFRWYQDKEHLWNIMDKHGINYIK